MGASFESYRRRHRDVLMGHCGYKIMRHLGDVPMRRRWVFHLRLVWDTVKTHDETSLLRPLEASSQGFNEMLWRRSHWDVLAMFHREVVGCFIWSVTAMLLGCTETRHYNISMTSYCRMGTSANNINSKRLYKNKYEKLLYKNYKNSKINI